ncbi:chemerin-like receptor 2 [Microcaecilia unicolor]|uniref:Chemerin-like receptor 2 n=1 Tax=Microcaecilia unicolor TaxID=1415580 RepID=A0A6P7YMR2_9AMPH|nr:G-protein coupled receptor 1 [Microcaecilia unicolor]XP_030066318.1 G-protein coupled receptor 1 [Microcaecilia unicolor]XP_030066319.1 G-protein coupled receptor 1 [Microcaecilia unicolor]
MEDDLMMNHSYDYFYNYSNYEYYELEELPQNKPHPHILHLVSIIVYSTAFVLGVPGNAIVIWFTGFKWEKSVSTLWFLNLAVADFIFVLFLPFHIIYVASDFHWPFGKLLCKVNSFIAMLNMFASIFFLTVISLDRYIHLIHPSFSQRHRTLRNSSILSAVIWNLAAIIAGPALYYRDIATKSNHSTVCYNNFHPTDRDTVILTHNALSWIRFLCGYLFPLLTMVMCYSFLIIKVKKRTVLTSSKFFWTAFAVVVVFFICWTPYHIFNIMELAVHHNAYLQHWIRYGMPLSTSLAFLNSCLNPVLYVLISKMFRVQFRASMAQLLKQTLREISQSATVSEQLRNSEDNANLYEYETPQ